MSKANETSTTPKKRRFGVILPLAVFAALAGLFFFALKVGDPSRLPSALIGKPVPQFDLPPLERASASAADNAQTVASGTLGQGSPAIVHFFASWCGPCHEEHPVVMALSEKIHAETPDVPIYGINYKDEANAARRFLGSYGDPYTKIGVDGSGRTAIDFGVYGVPETFVISRDGKVAYRQPGPLTEEVIATKIMPLLRAAPASAKTPAEQADQPSG